MRNFRQIKRKKKGTSVYWYLYLLLQGVLGVQCLGVQVHPLLLVNQESQVVRVDLGYLTTENNKKLIR